MLVSTDTVGVEIALFVAGVIVVQPALNAVTRTRMQKNVMIPEIFLFITILTNALFIL